MFRKVSLKDAVGELEKNRKKKTLIIQNAPLLKGNQKNHELEV